MTTVWITPELAAELLRATEPQPAKPPPPKPEDHPVNRAIKQSRFPWRPTPMTWSNGWKR